ncbi:MAG TPA: hypothetical protein VE871_11085 [Longimicrobium sp.]|nr:hypothetical protein [Longimicrobium sp.]
MPMEEIRRVGLDALARELGPVGTVRFLQQFETGSGDYTAERAGLPGAPSVAELGTALRLLRAGEPAHAAPES